MVSIVSSISSSVRAFDFISKNMCFKLFHSYSVYISQEPRSRNYLNDNRYLVNAMWTVFCCFIFSVFQGTARLCLCFCFSYLQTVAIKSNMWKMSIIEIECSSFFGWNWKCMKKLYLRVFPIKTKEADKGVAHTRLQEYNEITKKLSKTCATKDNHWILREDVSDHAIKALI